MVEFFLMYFIRKIIERNIIDTLSNYKNMSLWFVRFPLYEFCFTSHFRIATLCWIVHGSTYDVKCRKFWTIHVVTVIYFHCHCASVLSNHIQKQWYSVLKPDDLQKKGHHLYWIAKFDSMRQLEPWFQDCCATTFTTRHVHVRTYVWLITMQGYMYDTLLITNWCEQSESDH